MLRDSFFVYNDVFDVVKDLKEKGYIVGILSNHTVDWMNFIVDKFHLLDVYQKELIITSQEVECEKPQPKIYQILLDRLHQVVSKDINPEEIVFVDDKIANVKAAEAMGIRGVHFNRHTQDVEVLLSKLKDIL
jgi:HAD superfamily hydrolase (TIGR01509 family)